MPEYEFACGGSGGEPVILVHGHGNHVEGASIAPGIFKALAKSSRVIAIGVRRRKEGDTHHEPAAFGSQMTLDIIRLMDHLQVEDDDLTARR